MGRSRLGLFVLLSAVAVVGIPFPATADSVPPTVRKDVTLEPGTIRTSATQGAWFQRTYTQLPINANLVAVSFRSGAGDAQLEDLIIEARFRVVRGWSQWERLIVEPDEGPDLVEDRAGSGRVFAGPIWVGTANGFELRYAAPPAGATTDDLRLHMINTLGNASDPNMFQKVVSSVSSFFRGSKAHAMTVQPAIITRAQWGANESIRECCPRYAPAVHMAFVHHTAGSNSYSKSESPAIVRSIYAYHVKNRGWSDIGYNFLVDKYGQVFEGRYGGMTSPVIGAHVKGFNTGSTGISLMGTFTSTSPTASMIGALKNLLAWKLDVHHVPPIGTVVMTSGGSPLYPVGTKKTFNRISGHKDGQQTSCPGSKVYNLLPSIRSAVSTIGLPKLYLPAASTTVLTPNGDGVNDTLTLTAQFTTSITWTAQFLAEGGALIRGFGGKGTSVTVTWNGRATDGRFAKTGPVKWSIAGVNDAGQAVRPASGTFSYFNPIRVVVGDWDGDGVETPGTLVGNKWYLHNDFNGTPDEELAYGKVTDRPVAGDWDGDGTATPGIVRGNTWFLNNDTDTTHDVAFVYGNPTDVPVVGDWDGDGDDTPGVVRGIVWFLNDNFDGAHDGDVVIYGNTTDSKLAGDWDGDGADTVGIVRGNFWYLNNDRDGVHDVTPFAYGNVSDVFVVGDWLETGVDIAGVFRHTTWYLRDANTAGIGTIVFVDLAS